MDILIHLANLIYLFSYLVRDIFWLRSLTVVAILLLIPYFILQPEPLYAAVAWNILFAAINLYQIYRLWLERKPVFLQYEEEELRQKAFLNFSARNFQKLLKMGQWRDYKPSEYLIKMGKEREKFIVFAKGKVEVISDTMRIAELQAGQFIGEMSYMTENKTTANVVSIDNTRVFEWEIQKLNSFFAKHPELETQLQLLIGNDLCRKLQEKSGFELKLIPIIVFTFT